MEIEKVYDDEEMVILPPYWWVEYVDDDGHKHLAAIKDIAYLEYIKTRFTVTTVKAIEE